MGGSAQAELPLKNVEACHESRQRNQQFWGRWSGSYDGFMGSNSSLYEEMALRMKRRLSRQMCVLELACGTGLISQRLAGSVKSLEATDYAPEMIAEARKKVHSVRLHFSVQNATCCPMRQGSFDAVVIANGLHVIPDPEKGPVRGPPGAETGGLCWRQPCPWPGLRLSPAYEALKLAGFRSIQVDAQAYVDFVSQQGFSVTEQVIMGSRIAPLCYRRRCEGT